jgi:phosphatidyl-myo-inositol dimannoside synthase
VNYPRVAILTSEFPPQPGGIGNHAFNLAKELGKNGYSVQVLTDLRSSEGKEEDLFDALHNISIRRIVRRKVIILSYLNRIRAAFKMAFSNDLIIASGKFQLWTGALLSILLDRKYIAVVHGSELLLSNILLRKLTDLSLHKYDNVVAVSHFTKAKLPPKLPKVEVIYNGFNIGCNDIKKKMQGASPTLITVGNVHYRKGQQNVIKALPNLLKKFPNLQYRVVGIPTEKQNFENLAKKLGVSHAVRFYGSVSEEEKCNLLRTSDIFIMLSEATLRGDVEGFGIAILEANSQGLPAIGSLGCGIEEAIQDKFSGYLVNIDDYKKIVEKVEELLHDYERYSNNAKSWSTSFSWERVVHNYIHIIEN